MARAPASVARSANASGATHGVHLRGAGRQGALGPARAAVRAREYLAAARRAVHAPGLVPVKGDGEHGALRLDTHIDPLPARAAVVAAEQHADVAAEARTCRYPQGLRIPGNLPDIA